MISKATRAKLIEQLAECGTLSTSTASNLISKDDIKKPAIASIAQVMANNRRAAGERWLASSVHQVILP